MMNPGLDDATRYASSVHKHRKGRRAESTLLQKISQSLDHYLENPVPPPPRSPRKAERKASTAASEASKHAAKNFLAAKTLVKHLAQACAQEGRAGTADLCAALAAEYGEKYPALTRDMLSEGLARGAAGGGGGATTEDGGPLSRITARADGEMRKYRARVAALKRSREAAASAPEPVARRQRGAAAGVSPPKQRRKTAEEKALVGAIVADYVEARTRHESLPKGALETLAAETKRRLGMAAFELPPTWMGDVRRKYRVTIARRDGDDAPPPNRAREIFDDVYRKYADAKTAHGGKLPPGTFASLIEDVRREHGLGEVKPINLKIRCQARFTKEHPEFDRKKYVGRLSEDEKQRRQTLLNEIVKRYVREKAAGPKKLPDGTLERVIRETQADLGITDHEVNKGTVRDRLRRKAYHIRTGEAAPPPYAGVDAPLVATINTWRGQGIDVTCERGLDLANLLRKGKREEGEDGAEAVVLDARWWRKFLARNKRTLVSALPSDGTVAASHGSETTVR